MQFLESEFDKLGREPQSLRDKLKELQTAFEDERKNAFGGFLGKGISATFAVANEQYAYAPAAPPFLVFWCPLWLLWLGWGRPPRSVSPGAQHGPPQSRNGGRRTAGTFRTLNRQAVSAGRRGKGN